MSILSVSAAVIKIYKTIVFVTTLFVVQGAARKKWTILLGALDQIDQE